MWATGSLPFLKGSLESHFRTGVCWAHPWGHSLPLVCAGCAGPWCLISIKSLHLLFWFHWLIQPMLKMWEFGDFGFITEAELNWKRAELLAHWVELNRGERSTKVGLSDGGGWSGTGTDGWQNGGCRNGLYLMQMFL